ncbi:transposase family protein [Shewanella sp. KX20019]|uniref:transposase family protein n=1 Tax=Shewanella sp. KX20019 TaxID=2803864 RepID=UPI00192774DC|nr:transposase family protein [Shewanella sp. KX20019]QQX81802.1 transposase family protein [Shewanella sp. KX20019]
MSHNSIITDHRQNWKVVHFLPDILFLAITAIIAGCDGWELDTAFIEVDEKTRMKTLLW